MSKYTDMPSKAWPCRPDRNPNPPLNFFDFARIKSPPDRRRAEEFDKDVEIRATCWPHKARRSAAGAEFLRRRSGRSRNGVEKDPAANPCPPPPPRQPSLRHACASSATRRLLSAVRSWRCIGCGPRPRGFRGLPRHLPLSDLGRQLHQARPSIRAFGLTATLPTGRQEQCGMIFYTQPRVTGEKHHKMVLAHICRAADHGGGAWWGARRAMKPPLRIADSLRSA